MELKQQERYFRDSSFQPFLLMFKSVKRKVPALGLTTNITAGTLNASLRMF